MHGHAIAAQMASTASRLNTICLSIPASTVPMGIGDDGAHHRHRRGDGGARQLGETGRPPQKWPHRSPAQEPVKTSIQSRQLPRRHLRRRPWPICRLWPGNHGVRGGSGNAGVQQRQQYLTDGLMNESVKNCRGHLPGLNGECRQPP